MSERSLESIESRRSLVFITLGILATFTSVTAVVWLLSLLISIP